VEELTMRMMAAIPHFLAPWLRFWTQRGGFAAHLTAAPGASSFQLRHSNPEGLWRSPRLTQVVEVQNARMIYLSGQTPADANYKVRATDLRAQANAVYDNIEIALSSVGAGWDNVVKTTTYLVDAAHIPELREVRLERLRHLKAPPANTLLVIGRLAEPEFLIEIDVVAAVPAA
jgi:enamine deaminase RidA (YjgF/YER057c/UK114 family)